MDKGMMFTVFIIIALIAAFIYSYDLNGTTGSVVYGKCWEAKELSSESITKINNMGCSIENNICEKDVYFCTKLQTAARVCCPSDTCPNVSEIYC